MKIHIVSDIHTDTYHAHEPLHLGVGDADLAIVAGDWANGRSIENEGYFGVTNARDVPVVALLGNHEWYGLDLMVDSDLKKLTSMAKLAGVTLIDREQYCFDDWVILGCTLWTDFSLYGPANWTHYAEKAAEYCADFRRIRQDSWFIKPEQMRELYGRDHAWLEQQLKSCDPERTIVATHFGPHPKSCHPVYSDGPDLYPYFINNTGLIEKYQPALWIHGHTHECLDYHIGRTRVVCNVRGYQREFQYGELQFRHELVLDLQAG